MTTERTNDEALDHYMRRAGYYEQATPRELLAHRRATPTADLRAAKIDAFVEAIGAARAALSSPAPAPKPADDLRAAAKAAISTHERIRHDAAYSSDDHLNEVASAIRAALSQPAPAPQPADDLRAATKTTIAHRMTEELARLGFEHPPVDVLADVLDAALSQNAPAPQPSLTDRQLRDQIVGEAE